MKIAIIDIKYALVDTETQKDASTIGPNVMALLENKLNTEVRLSNTSGEIIFRIVE